MSSTSREHDDILPEDDITRRVVDELSSYTQLLHMPVEKSAVIAGAIRRNVLTVLQEMPELSYDEVYNFVADLYFALIMSQHDLRYPNSRPIL